MEQKLLDWDHVGTDSKAQLPMVTACIVTHRSDIDKLEAAVQSFQVARVSGTICLVDNDSGEAYLEALQSRLKVAILRNPDGNSGFGAGQNFGLRRAEKTPYFLILNPDVRIHPGTLDTMVAYMEAHPEVGVACPRILFENGELQPLNKRRPSVFDLFARRFLPPLVQQLPAVRRRMDHYTMRDVGYETSYDVPYMSGCFMLFRREILERIGGFDERFFLYLEDADITLRAAELSRAIYLPNVVITHSWNRGGHKTWRLTWVTIVSAYRFFSKWGWKWI